jgi:outer membrane protein assembly factor BamB
VIRFKGSVGCYLFGLLGVAFALMVSGKAASADQWPTFRGADRTAVSSEKGLLDRWGRSGPKLLWKSKGAGSGYASPAVADGKVYTIGDRPSTVSADGQYLSCYDLNNGKQLWITKTGPAWNGHPSQPAWNGARSTPTIDEDRIYSLNADGTLFCLNTKGKILWKKSLIDDFGGSKHDSWGYSESPLVDGRLLVCTPGGASATMVALDKMTGELVWTSSRPKDVGAGHSSIVISQVNDRKVYVQNTGGGPMGVDAETGQLLWDYDIPAPVAFIPTPIIKDDLVFTVAGYGTGGALLKQIATADGGVTVKEIYGLNRDLDNKHGGLILVGDHLYGGRQDRNQLFCADLLTGEVLWRERGSGSGSTSVIAADGKLFVRFQDGKVALAKISTEGYEEISSFQTPGSGTGSLPSWAHPVIVDGKLLLREDDAILCYQIKR